MLTFYLLLAPLTLGLQEPASNKLSFTISDFLIGFQEGIQNDPGNPSNCVKSYSNITSNLIQVADTFQVLDIHTIFKLIQNLNIFFSNFVSSYDICNYSNVASRYLVDRETSILNFLISASKNINNFLESLRYFIMALKNNDEFGIGFYFASTIRYGLGISL